MNAERAPEKDDPVMVALVNYIQWVSDGIIDPQVRDDWNLLPPEAGPRLPAIAGVSSMRADPVRGASLYSNNCSDCHDERRSRGGVSTGSERSGHGFPHCGASEMATHAEPPSIAPRCSLRTSKSTMPFDEPETLSNQDALDIAAFINAFDKPRPSGMADEMYCHDDPDGIPSALRKPADWLVGCEYPGERDYFKGQGIDYDDMVLNGPWDELAAWRADEIQRLLGCGSTAYCTSTPNSSGMPAAIGSLGSTSIVDG